MTNGGAQGTGRAAGRRIGWPVLLALVAAAGGCRRTPAAPPAEAAGEAAGPHAGDGPETGATRTTPPPPGDDAGNGAATAVVEAGAAADGPSAAEAADGPAAAPGLAADIPAGDCGALTARYLSVRASFDHCERDGDCAELWPGLCPHGPHYVHREADVPGLFAIEQRIYAECPVAECEKPQRLGIARCEAGRCVPGRAAAPEQPYESCWDTEETYLEDGRREGAVTHENFRGLTPLLVYGAAAPGTLRVELDWGENCPDCRLEISAHNSGMASLVEGQRRREGGRETIELPAGPGPYYLLGRRAGPSYPYLVTVTLERTDGLPAAATLHGVGWQRRCEG